jgi:hypothetical protein
MVLIALTALIALVTLLRDAVSMSSVDSRSRSGAHPLVLLLGSLLSLMALFSLVRSIPADLASRWPTAFHVGFICFWLLLMIRSRSVAGEENLEPDSGSS